MNFEDEEKVLEIIENEVLNTNKILSEYLEDRLNNSIKSIEKNIKYLEEKLVMIGKLKNYNDLKKQGFSLEEILDFNSKDIQMIEFARNQTEKHFKNDHNYMFGYPANMLENSYIVNYLRWLESKMYFTNSCGNAYSKGNYRMNNAEQELEIISIIKDNLGLSQDDYWGYITMGGTEGNMWGIREGFSKFPNGKLYYSDAAHYSVAKMADMIGTDHCEIIESKEEKINTDSLLNCIIKNYNKNGSPAILLLTYGTTTLGSIDDIELIVKHLKKSNIPYYVHVDAALYGGIPNNQVKSPMTDFSRISKLKIDSISVSMHKYIGNQRTNGILLSRSKEYKRFIDYISQQDTTFLGSRDFPIFSALQRIRELYERTHPNEYYNKVNRFETLLKEKNIYYKKGNEYGNIFVINKPIDEICQKYQLSTFTRDGIEYAHIIIFPYHKEEIMKELVNDISLCKEKIKRRGMK